MNQLLPIARSERHLRRRLAAIAFLDVVGYARLMGENEEATLTRWSLLRSEVIEPQIAVWRGRVVDRAGDGIFAEFGSALDALRWAVEVQRRAAPSSQPGEPIRLRIALHLADVIDGPDGEVQGDGVNTTARLQSYAEPGGVIASQAIVDAVAGKTEAVFGDLGLLRLKNIERPVRAFRLVAVPEFVAVRPRLRGAARFLLPLAGLAGLATVCVVLLLACSPRQEAERLVKAALAIACTEQPCPRVWLERRALLKQAIAADPTYAKAYAEATFTYTNFVTSHLTVDRDEDLREAGRLATQAAALAPDQAFAHEARAAVLRQRDDHLEQALTAYLRALALEPDRPVLRANAGWMLVLLGRPTEAEPYLKSALDKDPNHIFAPAWLTYWGLAELFLDHATHAAELFRRAIDRQPKIAAAGNINLERGLYLAAALALAGDLDGAREEATKLRSIHPEISTGEMWTCSCRTAPGFVANLPKLRRGAVLAGVLDAG
jgi:class 3 adenylate cyclase/tetratricopeptide (TPR) repeat protein